METYPSSTTSTNGSAPNGELDRHALDLLMSGDIDEVMAGLDRIVEAAPSYERLFERWESQRWSSRDFDFSEDARQWREELDEFERENVLWTMSAFFIGEERVTTELVPFALAAPSDEARAFLTTQMSDEAKHAVFFDRWFREVLGVTVPGLRANLDKHAPLMNDAYNEIFHVHLHGVAERIRLEPDNLHHLYEGVTLYMLVIEGMLALTGTRFMLRAFRDRDRFPGFVQGFTAVARDESRHVGFGVKLLADAVKEDPTARATIAATLKKVLPAASMALVPPYAEDPYDFTDPITGVHSSEVFAYAAESLRKKLAAVGIRPEDVEGGPAEAAASQTA